MLCYQHYNFLIHILNVLKGTKIKSCIGVNSFDVKLVPQREL